MLSKHREVHLCPYGISEWNLVASGSLVIMIMVANVVEGISYIEKQAGMTAASDHFIEQQVQLGHAAVAKVMAGEMFLVPLSHMVLIFAKEDTTLLKWSVTPTEPSKQYCYEVLSNVTIVTSSYPTLESNMKEWCNWLKMRTEMWAKSQVQ